MAKSPANHRQPWTKTEDALLRRLAKENTPTRVMALKLKRTPAAVQQHAYQAGVSLRPTNQRPNKGRAR